MPQTVRCRLYAACAGASASGSKQRAGRAANMLFLLCWLSRKDVARLDAVATALPVAVKRFAA